MHHFSHTLRIVVTKYALDSYKVRKVGLNTKTALVWLAFPINAHQNANQKANWKCVCMHTRRSVHLHPISFTRPSCSIFRGSGSKTRVGSGNMTPKWTCSVIALFPGSVQFQPSFSSLAYHRLQWKAGQGQRRWAGPENKTTGFVSNSVTSDIPVCVTM